MDSLLHHLHGPGVLFYPPLLLDVSIKMKKKLKLNGGLEKG